MNQVSITLPKIKTSVKTWPNEVYKSTRKHFVMTTKVVERNDSVVIQRTIRWVDSKRGIVRMRRELQSFDCSDFVEENYDHNTYDEEFKVYYEQLNMEHK